MKPASIVSLVIAVLLIVVGLVGCILAQNMAQANGEFLFSETRGDDYIQTVDLTDSEISKIELIASDVEINIFGRQEKAYVEFVNFKENYYSISSANRVLSFDEIPDIQSMLKFWENGFSFKGMRYIFNFKKQADKNLTKSINVYLTSDKDIKIFEIKAENLILNIENMTTATDYNITAVTAEINGNVIRTASSFNINASSDKNSSTSVTSAQSVTMNLDTALIQKFTVNSDVLNIYASKFRCSGEAIITSKSGQIVLGITNEPLNTRLSVTTGGIITVSGNDVMSPYVQTGTDSADGSLTIISESADVSIEKSALEAPSHTEN